MDITLKQYIDSRVDALEKQAEMRADSLEKRLDGMNEIRGTMKDQASKFVDRAELTTFKEAVEKDLRILRESRAELQGKAEQSSVNVSLVLAAGGLIVSLVIAILHIMSGI